MFSYLQIVQKLVSKEIYARGIRYYLEGRVVSCDDLKLDFWRSYVVSDNHGEFNIKIPLLHLALDQSKFGDADIALQQVTTCTCNYFEEYGVCRHIVAVCASIEQEFGLSKNNQKLKAEKQVNTLLESIFEAEIDKKSRKWLSQIESYIYSSRSYGPHWFDEVITESKANVNKYTEFFDEFGRIVTESIKTWEGELRVINLIKQSLYFGGKFWWTFWLPYFDKLESSNKLNLLISAWKMYLVGSFREFAEDFLLLIRGLEQVEKAEMMELLRKEFRQQSKVWVNFAIESHYYEWLSDNLDTLDPENLIRVHSILHEEQDEIERRLLGQVKVWVNFLQSGNYDELLATMNKWQTEIGRTDLYDMATNYIKDNHPKKKRLIAKLS
ncbi:MAG: SWIM zinc finger family protein [Patescibacteria group bacterium]